MNTLDLDALQRFTEQARRLQTIAADLQPFLELVKELDGKNFAPADRLIRAGEAAQILGFIVGVLSGLTSLFVRRSRNEKTQTQAAEG